ncbi:MAG: hypothetical protein ABIG95_05970 [Candidatus Woesearchaeota archaeon]
MKQRIIRNMSGSAREYPESEFMSKVAAGIKAETNAAKSAARSFLVMASARKNVTMTIVAPRTQETSFNAAVCWINSVKMAIR